MRHIDEWIRELIRLREAGQRQMTLLAVCPNSAAVAEAAVMAARRSRAPMLFAATLNQVDRDGGYTGWTPAEFVAHIRGFAQRHAWSGPLVPCLDHGGPWLKDRHRAEGLSYDQTLSELRLSLTACLEAGYQLLHIDPTVDPDLAPGSPLPVETLVERTVGLIAFAEAERQRLGLSPIAYEVGSEEVHGGLVDLTRFDQYLAQLQAAMEAAGLMPAWPCFIVAQVGTDLHTTAFDPQAAERLFARVAPLGSLIKGHYTDEVDHPEAYPASGMGGANVGPEFTAVEFEALEELEARERAQLSRWPGSEASEMVAAIENAVVRSGRWKKWLQPGETGAEFTDLSAPRRRWLVQTGARYIWTEPTVLEARRRLYENLRPGLPDAHAQVVERIAARIGHYLEAFELVGSLDVLDS
jgi:tagatose-1,6-bisphosphate aldolase non-catalytic subunit AgaZ/GatZ